MDYRKKLFVLLLVLVVLQIVYYYDQLPDRVARHFDASGNPNGWSSKEGFFAVYFCMVALFSAIFFFLPTVLGKVPTGIISLPNREYWLAPQRKEETLRELERFIHVMGIATLIFLVLVFQSVIDANLEGEPKLSFGPIWVLILAYPVFTIAWAIRIVVRFSRKPQGSKGMG